MASKGPVDASLCSKYGGVSIRPIEFKEPVVISQGVAIYNRKSDGYPFLGVSFTTSSSVIVVIHTCAWPVAPIKQS
jgi:hypothetical protein